MIALAAMAAIAGVAWWPVKSFLIEKYGVSELVILGGLLLQRLGFQTDPPAPPTASALLNTSPVKKLPEDAFEDGVVPFREIGERLGRRSQGNDFFSMRGVTIFDANGDNRPDLFFPHPQRTIAKQVTEDNILTDRKVKALPCALFLNQGNDRNGDPIFSSVQDLIAQGNRQYVREELLIEGKYQPRSRIDEDESGPGRIPWGAVSADFNGDGRLDLYVLNAHYGLLHQTQELGLPVYPAPENLGRPERREPLVLRLPSFLWSPLEDGLGLTIRIGERSEPAGRNTLYLNLGDRDQDGIPEWEDFTDEAGVGGRWSSASAAVADYDRDGDLDLYVANFLDLDYFGFGTNRFAGHRNQLYTNQLSETGRLRFVDLAAEFKVSGLHDEEGLKATVYVPGEQREIVVSEQISEGRVIGEKADHSWSSVFSDWNGDGWPDLVVANDIGNRLRVYENLKGRGFRYLEEFNDQNWEGCWMGMSAGDLDTDGREEIFVTNCGSQVMSVRNTQLLIEDAKEANIQTLAVLNYSAHRNTLHNEILQFNAEQGFQKFGTRVLVHHSPYIAPDQTRPENVARRHLEVFEKNNFATSLAGLEFAWNAPLFDVDNDGDLDIYVAGSLMRGNDNFLGDWSGNPGRLLVNESTPGNFVFRDRTLEYRLLDMAEIDYDSNPPRRPAPGTGWHKRDIIYLTDLDSYSGMGLDASESKIHDIFRMHEAAFGVLASDLNGDGHQDLVVTHGGGYNSVAPTARNLKVEFAGRVLAVPAPNKVLKPPTNFEPGPTFVFINGGPPKNAEGNWVKIRLRDPEGFNVYGIGAKVKANDSIVRWVRATQGAAFGASHEDLHVGLGEEALRSLDIVWPSHEMDPQHIEFETPIQGDAVCVDRKLGVVGCQESPTPEI